MPRPPPCKRRGGQRASQPEISTTRSRPSATPDPTMSAPEPPPDDRVAGAGMSPELSVQPSRDPTRPLDRSAHSMFATEDSDGPLTAEARDRPRSGTRVGHYELIRELGRGGMGVVFLARDNRLARRVAIKFLHSRSAKECARFLPEARATARCQHENIVVIHDVGEFRGFPYMVLEYLQGQTLHQLMGDAPMAAPRVLELMIPVARALVRAHEHGIVHRDLKPANIFVTDHGAVKVLDFGVAKPLAPGPDEEPSPAPDQNRDPTRDQDHGADGEPGDLGRSEPLPEAIAEAPTSSAPVRPGQLSTNPLTRPGAMVGTMPYMSPEQLRAQPIDARTDLWAFGIILYKMLLGRHPLVPLSAANLLRLADGQCALPSARARLPELGPLAALIDRCLVRDRSRRVAGARAVLDALEACQPERHAARLSADDNPFAGLAAFQERDAGRFFGRDRNIASVIAQLRHEPRLTVVGPSGAGKSSLIRAGVIPALKQQGERWRSLIIRPGRQPLIALAHALFDLTGLDSTPTLDSSVHTESGTSRDALAQHLLQLPGAFGAQLRDLAAAESCRLLLFIDQLEELYTLGAPAEVRAAFARCLGGVADDASSPLRVIATIRSDFLERALHGDGHPSAASRGLVFIPPMSREALRQALTGPVAAAGHSFDDPALIDAMLDDLDETPGSLPLLQFAASRLWEARDRERRQLTRTSYWAMGGVAGTLAGHADTVLSGMTPGRRRLARAVLQRLVTPERTRAVVTLAELTQPSAAPNGDSDGDSGEDSDAAAVVEHLAEARLIAIEDSIGRADERASATVELIHESLITRWPTLR
ncbi:MAG: protein kinase, partial [Myxococcota bacterium]